MRGEGRPTGQCRPSNRQNTPDQQRRPHLTDRSELSRKHERGGGGEAEMLQSRSQDGHVSQLSNAATMALSRLSMNPKVKSNFSRLVERLRPNYDSRTDIFHTLV